MQSKEINMMKLNILLIITVVILFLGCGGMNEKDQFKIDLRTQLNKINDDNSINKCGIGFPKIAAVRGYLDKLTIKKISCQSDLAKGYDVIIIRKGYIIELF